jgi:hypothetical protein
MSEPIFDHLWHDVTGHFHHHKENTMSLLTDLTPELTDGLNYVDGWVDRVKNLAAPVLDLAAKYENNAVVKELEAAGEAIDAPATDVIVNLIRYLASKSAPAA